METQKRQYSNADTIYRRLEAYFSSQSFAVGDRVPPERTLAVTLNANRTTLRNALQRMVKEGILTRHVGRGTFFTALPVARHRQLPMGSHASAQEISELRAVIEPEIGALAVSRLPQEIRTRIQRYEIALAHVPPAQWLEQELSLYQWLAEATGNSLLVQIAHMIATMRRQQESNLPSLGALQGWRSHQHAVCAAILQKNAEQVRQLLRQSVISRN